MLSDPFQLVIGALCGFIVGLVFLWVAFGVTGWTLGVGCGLLTAAGMWLGSSPS